MCTATDNVHSKKNIIKEKNIMKFNTKHFCPKL